MSKKLAHAAALVATHAEFMQGGVAIDVASRDAHLLPYITVGCGCRIAADGRRVSVFVNRRQSVELLEALAETGHIAVTFGQPSTHRSMQVKGRDAVIEAFNVADLPYAVAYRDDFASDMQIIGVSRALTYAYVDLEPDELVTVSFTPLAVFDQTPGPVAGERLDRSP